MHLTEKVETNKGILLFFFFHSTSWKHGDKSIDSKFKGKIGGDKPKDKVESL